MAFCVFLAGGGCFYLGTKFAPEKEVKVEEKENKEEAKKEVQEFFVPEYNIDVNTALYNYVKSSYKTLEEYLNGLSNQNKLYLAGISDNVSLKELKNNLISYFGSDLGLKGEDYCLDNDLCMFKYDEAKDKFTSIEVGTDSIGSLGEFSVFNYKIDSVKQTFDEVVVTYYGLYREAYTLGPDSLTNNKNINRLLREDEENDGIPDELYFNMAFEKNKNDFFKFVYTYNLDDGKYVLVDFKQL